MTVKELIIHLQQQEPTAPVYFTWQYGDYGRTEAAEEVATVEELYVKEWPYGCCYKVVEDTWDEDVDDGARLAVVIKG